MSATFKVEGRRFIWSGTERLHYVRKGFPRAWVPAPYATATHVIHMWLPDAFAPWEISIRKVGSPR
jgi:hypothetical protein